MLNRIHHIAIICSDYRRSMDFYVEKLGFSVVLSPLSDRKILRTRGRAIRVR